jgi:hypothetical protein
MRTTIWSPYGECPIQHTETENKPVARITGLVVPLLPDDLVAGVSFASRRWHCSAYHQADEKDRQTDECKEVGQPCDLVLTEHDDAACNPLKEEKQMLA